MAASLIVSADGRTARFFPKENATRSFGLGEGFGLVGELQLCGERGETGWSGWDNGAELRSKADAKWAPFHA